MSTVGERLRRRRKELGWSPTMVAERAGLSRRYLTELEAGRANPSLLKLIRLARALRLDLADWLDLDLSSAAPDRIALIGLRGAGKTTVGRLLALHLECPFVEIDRQVEENAGLSLSEIFNLHGEPFFRRLQGEALEESLSTLGACVIELGGAAVEDPVLFERVRSTCRTVWLRAAPEEHIQRVLAQGDLRPFQRHPRALEELKVILARRAPAYGQADLVVETDGRSPEDVAQQIVAACFASRGL